MNTSEFISISIDGSTTRKSTEYKVVVARYVPEVEHKNKVWFIGLSEIENLDPISLAEVTDLIK